MKQSTLALSLALLCAACTSTTDPVVSGNATDAGAADAKPKDGSTTTTGGDSGGTTSTKDSGGTTTGGPCAPISGGLPCDPGKIACGGKTCDAATEDCCIDITGASAKPGCAAKGTCGSKVGMTCDEADDCGSGEVCCFTASGLTPTGSICQVGPCGLGDFSQSCRGDGECTGTGSCGKGDCKGFAIQTCAPLPSTACQ